MQSVLPMHPTSPLLSVSNTVGPIALKQRASGAHVFHLYTKAKLNAKTSEAFFTTISKTYLLSHARIHICMRAPTPAAYQG